MFDSNWQGMADYALLCALSSSDTLGGRSRRLSLSVARRSGVKRFDLPKLLE